MCKNDTNIYTRNYNARPSVENSPVDIRSERGAKQVGAVASGLLRRGMGSTSVIDHQCDPGQGTASHGVTISSSIKWR